ncbi:sulfatase-like hydrolase/transferase [Paracraurococcus lichenis]|uniref:Sulfatase-like hydrolase/transferase n=1 Tax=Paracraurococcus lichenis TaxID=3064888 RepID=A0ABT9E0W2_9PROT|nr:sulfatase-like hydrolase/transferase [Paracraurococcus sp. LOR1-02]MDO9709784.1 sulfatase-like hydrolase/transferase [Paracraurococcus sp. LOR1-02]
MIRNVLFVMCDQLRWDHLSCAGHPFLRTPNVDALAQRGVRFPNAFVQSGICGPSRMSFYTGRYVSSHGATHNRVPLSVGEVTLGWHLRESGRTLALAGKTHVLPDAHGMRRLALDGQTDLTALLREGWFRLVDRHDGHHGEPDSAYAHWLRAQGYDSRDPWTDFVIAVEGPDGKPLSGWKMRNARLPARVREEHSETAYTTDRAIEFMTAQGDEPWVLHLSYVKPHWPYIAPAPYHALYGPEHCLPVQRHAAERGPDAHPMFRAWQDEEVAESFQRDEAIATVRPTYQGLIRQVDDHLGRVWETMERLGRWRDTLVIFTADHGDYLGDHWLGEKELFHDCVQKVPFLVYDPSPAADATRGTEDPRLVEAIDCVPTILEALGCDPARHVVEGRSLLPALRGEAGEDWRDFAVSELDWTFRGARRRQGHAVGQHMAWMVRTDRWKYVHWTGGYRPQLFDLHGDPEEFHDLGADGTLAGVREAMRHRLLTWFTRLKSRTTITWAEAEQRTDSHKKAGVFLGEW